MVAAILTASAGAGVIKGCGHAWLHDGDTDMQARVFEYQLFRDGIYPNPRIDVSPPTRSRRFTVYPPYALPQFIPFFEPGGKLQGRVMIEMLSALSLGVMGAWGWRRFRPWGVPMAAIAAVSGGAIAGNSNCFALGQFSIICMGFVALQLILLERGRPVAAGICWALAMIKPQIAIAFAPLFLFGEGVVGLLTGIGILLALSLGACAWTEVSPFALVDEWLFRSRLKFNADGGLPALYAQWVSLNQRFLVGIGLATIAAGGLWLQRYASRRGSIDRLLAAAVIPVLCMITIYHRNYDHVMLWPLLLATLEQALARRQRIDAFVAVATAVSLFAPERLFGLVPFAVEARALVWIGAAVHLFRTRGLSPGGQSPLEAAAPHNAEPLGGDLQGCDRGSQA